jgi:integrase
MFKCVKDNITIASVLDKRYMAANGEWTVRIRVTRARVRKYYPTGITCSEQTWERLKNTKSKSLIDTRDQIENSYNIIKSHVFELQSKDKFTFDNLKRSLLHYSGEFINTLFEQKIAELKNAGQIGTMETYENTLSNIRKYAGNNIPIENITIDWLKAYEVFLLDGRSVATVSINMRNIRAIMNIAKEAGLIKGEQYPFGKNKYEIKASQGRKRALTSEQIKKIVHFTCDNSSLMMYKDIWMFIYFCNGINMADLLCLKFSNIIEGEICFIRKKTKRTAKTVREIRATLTSNMKEIIKRWGNEPNLNNYIFPFIKQTDNEELFSKRKKAFLKIFNKNIRLVGAAVGIFDITSYTARHSFATVLKRKGANIAYISESLGHTSLNTTQIYLDSFEKEEREKNAKLLEDF